MKDNTVKLIQTKQAESSCQCNTVSYDVNGFNLVTQWFVAYNGVYMQDYIDTFDGLDTVTHLNDKNQFLPYGFTLEAMIEETIEFLTKQLK